MSPLLTSQWKRWTFILVTVILLAGSLSLFYTKTVALKMLPFDNKNEFQVVIDMPEGTPLMLATIPLSLIGIIGGHWILGAFFTATSMIRLIALADVMVRNSVLLIDFIDIRLKEGIPLDQAIIEAGAVRTTPILLTAGTVVLGALIILFDPIFQGLAISLMGGTITSTMNFPFSVYCVGKKSNCSQKVSILKAYPPSWKPCSPKTQRPRLFSTPLASPTSKGTAIGSAPPNRRPPGRPAPKRP